MLIHKFRIEGTTQEELKSNSSSSDESLNEKQANKEKYKSKSNGKHFVSDRNSIKQKIEIEVLSPQDKIHGVTDITSDDEIGFDNQQEVHEENVEISPIKSENENIDVDNDNREIENNEITKQNLIEDQEDEQLQRKIGQVDEPIKMEQTEIEENKEPTEQEIGKSQRSKFLDAALKQASDFEVPATTGLLIDPDEDPALAALIDAELKIVGRPNPEQEKPVPPYLPALPEGIEYTLVLDLDETLIHYKDDEDYYLVRPGVAKFLQELSTSYEIVLFTASVK